MTVPLFLDNLTHISIKDAAAGSHFSTEYLARPARIRRIRARMPAGMQFFETYSVQQFDLHPCSRATPCA